MLIPQRKHRAEMLVVERRLEEREQQMVNLQIKLAENERSSTRIKAELERCKSEGNGMRDEVSCANRAFAFLTTSAEPVLSCPAAESAARRIRGATPATRTGATASRE